MPNDMPNMMTMIITHKSNIVNKLLVIGGAFFT